MSADNQWVVEAIAALPPHTHKGKGFALDLGGGRGKLCKVVEQYGWRYVNADLKPGEDGLAVKADAQALPFRNQAFTLLILKDALEHFEEPKQVMQEVRRVCQPGAVLIIWVPFLWPFHGDDYYRYTPLAISKLLHGFHVVRFESPLWVFSVIAQAVKGLAQRLGLNFLDRTLEEVAWRLDRWFQPRRSTPRAFAAAYLVVGKRDAASSDELP